MNTCLSVEDLRKQHHRVQSRPVQEMYNNQKEVQELLRMQKAAFYILQIKLERVRSSIKSMSLELTEINFENISNNWDKIEETNRLIFKITDDPRDYTI